MTGAHLRDSAVRRVSVAPTIALPPLCLFTRRGDPEQPLAVREFAHALRRSTGAAPKRSPTR